MFTNLYGKLPGKLRNLLYLRTPDVKLLSASKAVLSGYGSRFEEDCCSICSVSSSEVALNPNRTFRSYVATETVQKVPDGNVNVVEYGKQETSTFLWHKCLAHLSIRDTRQGFATDCWKDGSSSESIKEIKNCIGCDRSKMKNRPFKSIYTARQAEKRLRLIHNDVHALLRVK